MKKRLLTTMRRILCTVAAFGLLITEVPFMNIPGGTVAAAEPDSNFSNLVVFVDFTDSSHDHSDATGYDPNNCPTQSMSKVSGLYNGDGVAESAATRRSLKYYMDHVSYGALRVENYFPQYESQNITPIQLGMASSSYVDMLVVSTVIDKLDQDYAGVLSNMSLDRWGQDGCVDNLTIIVSDKLIGGGKASITGKKANYGGDNTINGLRVGSYNIIPESEICFGYSESGVIIHEFMHSLGYPDLYQGNQAGTPVGPWDIMSQESYMVQYPLAYMRQHIAGWLDLPVVTESVAGYTLTSASDVTTATKNQQAVILKTPYSDTEFFVVEYRKKGTAIEDYDRKIPGSGIIVYRINTAYSSNIGGAPFVVYVYRPGDSYDANGHEKAENGGDAYLSKSVLSLESGRTGYGNADLSKGLTEGALTYSDGRNSGIVIKNVGSASGSQITFDITFPQDGNDDYWKTLTTGQEQEQTITMASCMDSNGTMYYIKKDRNTGKGSFCRFGANGWSTLGTAPSGIQYSLCVYNNSVYTFYTDGSRGVLAQWNGTGWSTVHTVNAPVTDLYMTADASGIYCTYDKESQNVYAFQYTTGGILTLGDAVNGADKAANGQIAVCNGRVAVIYRDWQNNNAIRVKTYQNGGWANLGSLNLSSGNTLIRANGDYFYIAVAASGGSQGYVYRLDSTAANPSWNVVGGTSFTTESIGDMDMCFQGSSPYILYLGASSKKTVVKALENNQWITYGATLANDIISDLHAYTYQNQMYVTYISTVNNHVYIRTNAVKDSSGLTGAGSGEVSGGSGTTGGNTGGSTGGSGSTGGNTGGSAGGSGSTGGNTGGSIGGSGSTGGNTGGSTGGTVSYPDLPDGWQYVNGSWYYYSNHRPHFGWLLTGGNWYYLNEDGTMATGWAFIDGTWYYLNASGAMATGWVYVGNVWYYLMPGGAMATGWINVGGAWYYLNPGGDMVTGWAYVNGAWYYLNPNGDMATGWVYVNGAWYYLNPNGDMATGWVHVGGTWYYLNAGGDMATGWIYTGGAWYYLRPNGSMVTGWMRIGGKRYHFNASGVWDR